MDLFAHAGLVAVSMRGIIMDSLQDLIGGFVGVFALSCTVCQAAPE